MKVKFTDVGSRNHSWEAETEGELTYKWLYGQVKKNGSILSSGVDFSDDGKIFVGFRSVGQFEVIKS